MREDEVENGRVSGELGGAGRGGDIRYNVVDRNRQSAVI